MPDTAWVFGLSLDQEFEWSFAQAQRSGLDPWTISSAKADRRSGSIPTAIVDQHRTKVGTLLKDYMHSVIKREIGPEIMDSVRAVGVSAVGIVDRERFLLHRAALESWGIPEKEPLADFNDIFNGLFAKNVAIDIHNETTAKCLAEWATIDKKEDVSGLLYVLFSEGVNAGFVLNSEPINAQMNTELGHIWPRPHKNDLQFNPYHSGCRYHKYCFEGFAGIRRIQKSWGKADLFDTDILPAWDVISFYIAQMCMNGVLCFSPTRILLGGRTIFTELVPYIKDYFRVLNQGNCETPYVSYKGMEDDNFISMARISVKEAGIAGALEVARRVLDDPNRKTARIFLFPKTA
jgi:predicted NBD/HSP70 family sugar kinase